MPSKKELSATRIFTPPRGIARVLQVLKILAQRSQPMTLAELSMAVGIPRTSLFAILKGLQQEGYLVFERDFYSVGPEAVKLGNAITQQQNFPASVMPVLEEMGKLSNETIILSEVSNDRRHVIYLSVVESKSPLRFSVDVGTERPLSASALGQAILSFMPAEERENYLKTGGFERFTADTLTTATQLRKAVRQIREESVAVTIGGTVEAAIGIASPYFGSDGAILGAVNVAGPTSRMIDRVPELKTIVVKGGEAISRILGYEGPYPRR